MQHAARPAYLRVRLPGRGTRESGACGNRTGCRERPHTRGTDASVGGRESDLAKLAKLRKTKCVTANAYAVRPLALRLRNFQTKPVKLYVLTRRHSGAKRRGPPATCPRPAEPRDQMDPRTPNEGRVPGAGSPGAGDDHTTQPVNSRLTAGALPTPHGPC